MKTENAEISVREKYLDKIRGSLFGGAAGDALGYSVEFFSDYKIFEIYGEKGITGYRLRNGIAEISDDTQMTLFTANGILTGAAEGGDIPGFVSLAYQDWPTTQCQPFGEEIVGGRMNGGISWLLDVPKLYSRRAPGNTCLSALAMRKSEGESIDFDKPINNSKGCGGIMRTAPLPLFYKTDSAEQLENLDKTGAMLSAITHGHSLGYMPSAVLTHIINQLVYPLKEYTGLREIITEATETVKGIYAGDPHIGYLEELIYKAIRLSENEADDLENIRKLGEGWVAEETLAISIYCALKYCDDFSKGIIAAVNHSGDSDSTGAVTGNILGALLGYGRIDKKWIENLELAEVIDEIAVDLYRGSTMSKYVEYTADDWAEKYIRMRRNNC